MNMSEHTQDALTRWRAAHVDLLTAIAKRDTTIVEVVTQARAIYVAAASPRKRDKFAPVPADPASCLGSLECGWRDLLTADQLAQARPLVQPLADVFAAVLSELSQTRNRRNRIAIDITTAIVGEGAAWRRVYHRSFGVGYEQHTARSAAALRAEELELLGYQVRCGWRTHTGFRFGAAECWIWTCLEGVEIAPSQVARSYVEQLQRARDFGLNPTAVLGAPIEDVIAAGADTCPKDYVRPRPVKWEPIVDEAEIGD